MLFAAAAIGYASFGSTLSTLTWQATAAVLLPAAVVSVVAIRRHDGQPESWSPLVGRSALLWSGLILVALLWEAWAFFHQPGVTVASHDYPSLSSLVGPYLHEWPVRFGAWLVWLYAGWRLVSQ
jgi:hypothetical protein